MTRAPETFAAWACDPQRTIEERFGAELLIEHTQGYWNRKHKIEAPTNYQALQLRRKARSLDPGYRPQFTRTQAERTEEVLPDITQLSFSLYHDRHLRDISFLRFCSPLASINISESEIRDWSPLLSQPEISSLIISDRLARDLRVLGQLPQLEKLQLSLGTPWPDMRGLENLPRLRDFQFSGNVLAIQVVPHLPVLRSAKLSHGSGFNVPLRCVADLPAMPKLRRLHLENTSELDGIERYPQLLNLEIHGYYTDLTPLAALPDLTHLLLGGGDYPDIHALTAMSGLRRVSIRIDLPPDLTPLAELPCLHEIVIEGTPVVPAELNSLNALCASWDDEFAATPPRTPKKLRLRIRSNEDRSDDDCTAIPRTWGDDLEMAKSETRWYTRKVNRRLNRLLGKGWGRVSDLGSLHSINTHVTITRPKDIDRLPAILLALRKLILTTRHPSKFFLVVDSMARYERDLDEIPGDDDDEFDAESEREEWEDARQQKIEREEFLKRTYRHQLSLETGIPIPPDRPDSPPDQDPDDQDYAGESAGPDSDYDLGTKLFLYTTLTEKAIYVNESDRRLAEMLFEMKAES